MMQSVIETDSREASSRSRVGLFVPPRVLSPHIPESSAEEVSPGLPTGQATLIYGLPMPSRDLKIQSDNESEYRPQRNSQLDLSQSDSINNPNVSNHYAGDVDYLAHCDSTSDGNIPRRLDGTLPGRSDIISQCSSNDINLTDVPHCESSAKSSEVDSLHQLTSSPCSPGRSYDTQQPAEVNESNSISTSCYYSAKTYNEDVGVQGECGGEHLNAQFSQLKVNLPSVEDGLSSGSELDVPGSDYMYQHNHSQETGELKPLNINPHLNSLMPDSLSRSTTHSPASSPIRSVSVKGSLVNPPLVQDIFGIMRDIKLALSEDVNATTGNTQPPTDTLAARMDDHTAKESPCTVIPSCPEIGSNTNSVPSSTSAKSITSIYGPDIPTTGNCSRITVQASIEPQCDNPVENDLPPQRRNTCADPEAPRLEGQPAANTSSPEKGSCAQHWNFPRPSNVAYSSDEDIAPVKPATHRSSRPAPRTRPSQAAPLSRHQQHPTESAPYSQASTTHEFDAEATEKLLAHNSKPENPIFAPELKGKAARQVKREPIVREVSIQHPDFPNQLIHGFLFHARYLGSTQLITKRLATRSARLYQAKEALYRVKDPDGDHQPSVAIELFVSVERIMIMDHTLKEILIDHTVQTVAYIADVGDVLVLMARGPCPPPDPSPSAVDKAGECDSSTDPPSSPSVTSSSTPTLGKESTAQPTKLLCHVLECDEAQLVAQSVNQAFQLAYMDYLREKGVDDLSTVEHLHYEDALYEQEIFCDELASFCNKDKERQVTITKQQGEPLGLVIVSSGWGSLLPTALLANMLPTGPAARCGQLSIGNRIITINGQSLVGLPLAESQALIKGCRGQRSVKLTIVDCPPVTEVFIRRASVDQQLGFSVQDGVVCSLLRGGIAERGGIRVHHRIIEINDESVVAMPHEQIVQILTAATGEIHIRTMPMPVFRLLTGQDTPNYI